MSEQQKQYELIVIGGSSGGLEALLRILPGLARSFPIPIVIVLHQSRLAKSSLVHVLQSRCNMMVCEPEDKEQIEPGYIYIAPPNYHLLIEADRTFSYENSELVNYSRPAIDVLFETAAEVYEDKLIGVLLTGSNADGANGIKQIKEHGGMTIVQNPDGANSPFMPGAAIQRSKVDQILNLDEIAEKLINLPS